MGRTEVSIDIKAPPAKVWEMLALDRWPEHMEAGELKSAKYIPEVRTPEDKYRVGASAHMTEKRCEYDLNVIESIENEKIMVRSKGKEVFTGTFILESVEEGTKVTSVLEYELPWGILGKAIDNLFYRRIEERNGKRILERARFEKHSGEIGRCSMSSEEKPRIEIETLESSEIAEASVLMSRAYNTNPITCAVFGGPSEKQRSMLETGYKRGLKKGLVLSAREDGKILGVMRVLEWPQCQKEYRSSLGSLNLLLLLLVLRGKALRLRNWLSVWAKHDPNKPHLHLHSIGVLPERQGQGIGSQLLGHFCEYVDKVGQAAYLETDVPRNIHLYERFGFKVIEETSVLSLPNWFMWRDAVGTKGR